MKINWWPLLKFSNLLTTRPTSSLFRNHSHSYSRTKRLAEESGDILVELVSGIVLGLQQTGMRGERLDCREVIRDIGLILCLELFKVLQGLIESGRNATVGLAEEAAKQLANEREGHD